MSFTTVSKRTEDKDELVTEPEPDIRWSADAAFLKTITTIGRNIRRCREHRKLTLGQAAEKMGVDYRHLAKIETGRLNPTLFTLFRVARGLEMPLDSLFPKHTGPKHEAE